MRTVTLSHGQDCFRFSVPTAEAWNDVAEYLSDKVKPGDIITLSGPLGAGKTTLVQALSKKLGSKKIPQSPTFALLRSYPLTNKTKLKRLIHVDAYRIEHERELLALDLDEELSDGKSLLVIEWPEKIPTWIKQKRDKIYDVAISV
ncbi:MAG: tRNA (adenosine(37)-N6)-threonylcarbamoyltransferase complex ATPase subunit type 1 TsaE [Patescibacteria group bacterium]|jgi:tRNA threonylcarbamoyladenosine biosynthesis protein TsaE